MPGYIIYGDNKEVLSKLPKNLASLIYIDPPFNTGKIQSRKSLHTERSEDGDRFGFKGNLYKTTVLGEKSYVDKFDDYLGFLEPRLKLAREVMTSNGSLYFHIDYREVHYCKILLDTIFGRDSFLNEIIWAYDYGARSRNRWPAKHDNILWYCKNPSEYIFNYNDLDRIPYMAPGLVGPEKAALGKTPTDTWWHTIVSPNGKEKTGYPTQKPLGIIKRIITASSRVGDTVLDFFSGSGTVGEAAQQLNRNFILVDSNPSAIDVMKKRLPNTPVIELNTTDFDNLQFN